ncbi:hypothetical protein ACIBAC_00690 [Streptomyces sp. NPDC051362]|uniref:hypothetical protein n=1 Tax=Streptomyces sp. NPDC051362 TaxID=3365651 RepID=UPI003797C6C7
MTALATRPLRTDSRALDLAEHLADVLPKRAGVPWTASPGTAWWTTSPAARLTHGHRSLLLVLTVNGVDVGWQLPDRAPLAPDFRILGTTPETITADLLRLVLPVLDDELARRARTDIPAHVLRLPLLAEIGAAMRAQGAATIERPAFIIGASTVIWSSGGLRYSATFHGSNPACDVQIQGPLRAAERAVVRFLPAATAYGRPVRPAGIRGRLERRIAQTLAAHGPVEQLDGKGLAFGGGSGPYGYVAASPDPAAKAHDITPVSVDVHGVGVDLLVSLAPYLAR